MVEEPGVVAEGAVVLDPQVHAGVARPPHDRVEPPDQRHQHFAFAEVGLDTLRDLIRRADHTAAEAIVVVCTNLAAARVVEELEQELGKPIHDSLVVSLWQPLRMLGWDHPIPGWGRLLREESGVRPVLRSPEPAREGSQESGDSATS